MPSSSMDLFLTPNIPLEKVASEVSLPEDPNQWPDEILQELFKQVPYISDFDPKIVMDRVEGERGFGFGHVEVRSKTEAQASATPASQDAAGIQEARVPIVIKEGKLQPLDILVTSDSKMIPLTENRLRQAIFRPQMFDITSKTPGDQSMVGQLYPPHRSNFGYGGAGASMGAEGMGKSGSAIDGEKKASILESILPTINEEDYEKFASRFVDDDLRGAYLANQAATGPAMKTLSGYEGWSAEKVAHGIVNSLRPSVLQITKAADGYKVKSASHSFWAPKERVVDRGKLVKMAGTKIALEADLKGGVTMATGANVDRDLPDSERPEQIKDFGIWKVQTTEGDELVGYVFPTLLDLDGQAVPVALFTNGSVATLQADMAGTRVSEGASLPSGPPRGKGIFYTILSSGKSVGTVPLTIKAGLMKEGSECLMAESFDGQPVKLSLQEGVKTPTKCDEETSLIPADWKWLPLDKAESVALVESVDGLGKYAAAREDACSVTIRAGGSDSFSISGMQLEKLGRDQTQFLQYDDAVFLLGGLGVAPSYAQEKLASAVHWQEPVPCRVGRLIETMHTNIGFVAEKTAEALRGFTDLRQDLVKEAAFIPDPMSVDTVLSLGFINPENLAAFVEGLPIIDKSQQRMCELLLASRLGLRDVPASALEKAIRATEEVFEGLKTLAFSQS